MNGQNQLRVEGYLNDKFQIPQDLDNIDALLAQLEEQQGLLRKQLVEARDEQSKSQGVLENETETLKNRADHHEKTQGDIHTRLQTLTHSNVSDAAVEKFAKPMQRLRKIEIAEEYIRTVQDAQKCELTAMKEVVSNPEVAVEACQKLQNLVSAVEAAQPAAEGAAPHLVDQLSETSRKAQETVRQNLNTALKSSLDGMKWPGKDLKLTGRPLESWSRYTELLLRLQEPALQRSSNSSTIKS